MAQRRSAENPLRIEDVGVIGQEGVVEDGFRPAPFEKFEEKAEDSRPVLPEDFEEWEGFKLANGSARENFAAVIRYPGSVFAAPGRYHNAKKVAEYWDVEPGHIVPEGAYLIPTNYLINREAQVAVLRGERTPEAAPAQPNPLRSNNKE